MYSNYLCKNKRAHGNYEQVRIRLLSVGDVLVEGLNGQRSLLEVLEPQPDKRLSLRRRRQPVYAVVNGERRPDVDEEARRLRHDGQRQGGDEGAFA